MDVNLRTIPDRVFGPDTGLPGFLTGRWIFLRALGSIFFSAFYSLFFQIRGLIGPHGILPAQEYLPEVARVLGERRFWFAPSVFWLSASDHALLAVCIVGMIAAALLILNLCPRGAIVICLIAFLSFISTAQDFASYQSDGMLLEAGFISLFFAPTGWRPGWAASIPPSRASRFLLVWLMFRIYFESGIAKLLGNDPEWRNFTAMDQYYQNGPLPTWIAWYAHHLPHSFHYATALLTMVLELVLIFAIFLPRRVRIVMFFVITPWQLGIILTGNYAFLNYLVLVLGVLLVDDKFFARLLPQGFQISKLAATSADERYAPLTAETSANISQTIQPDWSHTLRLAVQAIFLTWIFYATSALLISMVLPAIPLPQFPVRALEPFRFANSFGLFGTMTRERYEIEFEGSDDGHTWVAYPFRYKPQDVKAAPKFYAPYQPRFDWNLWFASLGNWRQYPFVVQVEQRLLDSEPDVLALFAGNPFPGRRPKQVRAVLWQYWFTEWSDKRDHELWWRRERIGLYAPTLGADVNGRVEILAWPDTPDTMP